MPWRFRNVLWHSEICILELIVSECGEHKALCELLEHGVVAFVVHLVEHVRLVDKLVVRERVSVHELTIESFSKSQYISVLVYLKEAGQSIQFLSNKLGSWRGRFLTVNIHLVFFGGCSVTAA